MWRRSSGRGRPATCRPSTPAGSSEFACASVRPVTTLPVMLRSTSVAFLPMVVGPVGGAVMVTGTVGGTQHDRDDLVPALLHPVGVPAEQPQQVLAIFDRPTLQHRVTVSPRRRSCSRTRCAPSSVGTRIDARPSAGSALRSISPDLTSEDTWRDTVEGSAHRCSARSLARLGPRCASFNSRNSGEGSPSGPEVTLDRMLLYSRTSWAMTDPISPACSCSRCCSGEDCGSANGAVSRCCSGSATAGVSSGDATASAIDVVTAGTRIMDSPPCLLDVMAGLMAGMLTAGYLLALTSRRSS